MKLFHMLNMTALQHPDKTTLVVQFRNESPLGMVGANAEEIAQHLAVSYREFFAEIPSSAMMSERFHDDFAIEYKPTALKKMGAFNDLYLACASEGGVGVREDIAWDIEHVLYPNNVVNFDVHEFEQPTDHSDIKMLYKTLGYNSHFKLLSVSPVGKTKFDKELATTVGEIFLTNESIHSLTIFDCGQSLSSMLPLLASAMTTNLNLSLTQISLLNNSLDDKDIAVLASGIASMRHGITHLNLAENQFTKKGMQSLVDAFASNRLAASLAYFNLSGNKIGAEGSQALGSWLSAAPNHIQELIIRDCGAALGPIAAGLAHGSRHLCLVDFSLNKFAKGTSVSDIAALFASAAKLSSINLSATQPLTEQLRDMLRALSNNSLLDSVELDLSQNALGVVGANLLAIELKSCLTVATLLVAGNAFMDKGLGILCDYLRDNEHVHRLDLSDNFDMPAFRKSKATTSLFMDSMSDLLCSDKSALRELILISTQKHSQMKAELTPLFLDMGSNRSIVHLDVSGQGMEYAGIVGVTKMLQLNNSLLRLSLDDNALDASCFKSILHAMKRNQTLLEIVTPINDLTRAGADSSAHQFWSCISEALRENQSVSKETKHTFLGRVSTVKSASLFFKDDSGELEKLRFAIRVHPKVSTLSPEQLSLLQEVDNNHQAAIMLAGFRGRTLDKSIARIEKGLTRFMAEMSNEGKMAIKEIESEALNSLKKSFSSLTDEFGAVEEAMDYYFRNVAQNLDLSAVVVKQAVQEITKRMEHLTLNQLLSGTSAVLNGLIFELLKIVAELNGEPSPSRDPVKTNETLRELSPRQSQGNPKMSPRSARDVLRKLSADSSSKERISSGLGSSLPVIKHSRSKSSGGSYKKHQILKSPRGKNLSLSTKEEVNAMRSTDVAPSSQRRISGSSVMPSSSLVSERAVIAMAQTDLVGERSMSPRKKKPVSKRRPRGPSTRFDLDDLAAVLPPEDEEMDL